MPNQRTLAIVLLAARHGMGKVGRPPKKRHRAANCRQLVQRNKSIVVTKWKKTAVRFGRSMVLKRWVPAPAAEYARNLVKAAKLARPPTKLDPVLPTVRLPKELDADDEDVQAKVEKLENLAAADGVAKAREQRPEQ